MSLISAFREVLKKGSSSSSPSSPKGYCPNCWGRSEYGGKFFEAAKNRNVDINSADDQLGWIQEYANKHLSGIELKSLDDELVCSKCKLTYKPDDTNTKH